MSRLKYLAVPAVVMITLLLSGCPQRTATEQGGEEQAQQPDQQVAGSEERANTVTVSMTEQNIQVSPGAVRYGDITVSFVNRSNAAKTFTLRGQGLPPRPVTLQPNETFNVSITQQQPNNFVITPVGRGTSTRPGSGTTQ